MKRVLIFISFLLIGTVLFAQSDTSTVVSASYTKAADATVTILWTQIEGKAASIKSPTKIETEISGLTAGEYKFQVKASDNYGNFATDVTTIKVLRFNQPITVTVEKSVIVIQLKK